MNFNSVQYLAFLALNVLVYYLLPRKARNVQLLVASYFFYACWNPKYALLMLTSTAITYACGLLVSSSALGKRRLWLALSFAANLGILFFFKYFNFVSGLIARGLALAGWQFTAPALDLLLPVGISFYTFQALGYTVDVYREDVAAERNFVDYALFVSFFPQLVAGPIERSGNILHQLKEDHPFRWENLRDGFLPLLWGLMKKVVLADNLAVLVNTVYADPAAHGAGDLALATVAFAFQIYCDFSAYSDMARGSARMLGFELMENFRCPYLATSVQDFWRRWHISLSSWFKDYLYFPLGGSRCGKPRRLLNLMIVFLVSGLWHGAALTFVAWGLLNGGYQAASILLDPLRKKWYALTRLREDHPLVRGVKRVFTFGLVCLAWVLFRANTLGDAGTVFRALFTGPWALPDWAGLGLSLPALGVMALLCVAMTVLDWFIAEKDLAGRINRTVALRYGVYFLLIVLVLLLGSYGTGYDPQDFVYFQF